MTKPKAAARTLGVVDQTLFNWAPCPPNTASRLDEPSWQLLGQRLHGQRFESRRQAKDEVVAWMLWYKRSRLHSTLADVGPMQFEANWLDGQPRQASASFGCGTRNPGARSQCPLALVLQIHCSSFRWFNASASAPARPRTYWVRSRHSSALAASARARMVDSGPSSPACAHTVAFTRSMASFILPHRCCSAGRAMAIPRPAVSARASGAAARSTR